MRGITFMTVYMKNTTIPIVYIGITIPMVPLPLGAGTTCPAPPIGGLIPGIGPGCKKLPSDYIQSLI